MQDLILIAEDNLDTQFILRHAFMENGQSASIRFVNDGRQVFDYMDKSLNIRTRDAYPRPALIVLDLMMPFMDGRETLSLLKKHPDLRAIPVIIVSEFISDKSEQMLLELGAKKCYQKPSILEEHIIMIQDIKKNFLSEEEVPTLCAPPSELVF